MPSRKTSSPSPCGVCKGNGRVLEISEFSWSHMYLAPCPRCFGAGTTRSEIQSNWRISDKARQEAIQDREAAAAVEVEGTCSGTPGRYFVEKK